jgi:Meiotically up-regulated gene 113
MRIERALEIAKAARLPGRVKPAECESIIEIDFRDVLTLPDPDVGKRQIYFMYCAGCVKIGVTNSILDRISHLSCGSPWRSQVVLLIPGGGRREKFLHSAFREHHIRGEWFRLTPIIRQAIEEWAPDIALQWLAQDEFSHREWIKLEAIALGLINEPSP